ncbi:hypothetical protein Tco_1510310, partial [Tanacetum coccineum]
TNVSSKKIQKVIEESDSTIPDPSHQTVTSTPPVITLFTDVSSTKPSSLVSPPPINTEATTITTSLPEITPNSKSISLTEAEEEAVAREVHATHARIVSESEPEPTQRRQSGIAFRDSFIVSKKRSSDSSKKLKGIQTLTPAKQEAADIMKALKESKKMSKRQPRTGGSNEGTGKAHEALAGPDPEPMKEDQTRSDSGKLHVSLAGPNPEHIDDEFLATAYPKVTPPPINTEATTVTTSLPEITPFIAFQLRVAKLEQDMSEVKETDHSVATLASIKSQVPTVVEKFLGTKLDDALYRVLE